MKKEEEKKMVNLIDIPFVKEISEWIWGKDDGAATKCLTSFSSPCFSQLVTKLLGVAIIGGSMLNKVDEFLITTL